MRFWMCEACKTLHGAAVNDCSACGSEQFVRMDVSAEITESFFGD